MNRIEETSVARFEQKKQRTFDAVEDKQLRLYLVGLYSKLPNKTLFPQSDLTHYNYGRIGNGNGRVPSYYELSPLIDKLRKYNILPHYADTVNNQPRIYYDTEGFLAFTSVAWETAQNDFKLLESGNVAIPKLLAKLGNDPLSDVIMMPELNRPARRINISHDNPQGFPKNERITPSNNRLRSEFDIRQTSIMYLGSLDETSIEKAKTWTQEQIKEAQTRIKNDTNSVSFREIPVDIAKMIITITEIHKQSTRPIEDVIDHMSNRDLRNSCNVVIEYLNKYPKIPNLAALLTAIKLKLATDSNSH